MLESAREVNAASMKGGQEREKESERRKKMIRGFETNFALLT